VSAGRSVAESAGRAPSASPFRQPKGVWAVAFACVVSFLGIGLVDPILPDLASQLKAVILAGEPSARSAAGRSSGRRGEADRARPAEPGYRGPELGDLTGEFRDAARVVVCAAGLGDLADPADLPVQRFQAALRGGRARGVGPGCAAHQRPAVRAAACFAHGNSGGTASRLAAGGTVTRAVPSRRTLRAGRRASHEPKAKSGPPESGASHKGARRARDTRRPGARR
jgi:hypothetical protein